MCFTVRQAAQQMLHDEPSLDQFSKSELSIGNPGRFLLEAAMLQEKNASEET
jgi:hypothetical protein